MRPRIVCHMIGSIDGRLLVDRWTPPAAGLALDLVGLYDEVAGRFGACGWIAGRRTMSGYANGAARLVDTPPSFPRAAHLGDRRDRNLAVAIDRHGRLHYGGDDAGGDHIVAVLGEQVSDAYLAELREDGVSYVFAGPDGGDLDQALATLGERFDARILLLEGGGIVNGAFLAAGLIDEISLLVYPGIDGLAGVPSIFEHGGEPGTRPAAGQTLRHFHTEVLTAGVVWLRYAVESAR